MSALRPPTLAELAALIRQETDEQRRGRLLDWYWAKAAGRDGVLVAHWHRQEYDWLVERQRRLHDRPALGAYRRRTLRAAA